jgi:type I restriction enzyme S subunit
MLPNKGGVCAPSNAPSGTAIEYKVGDILISNIRPYFQKIWQADCNGACSADVLCIRANNKADSKYLYYLLSQRLFFDYVMAGAKGCKMPRGDKKQIMQWQISLPSLEEQRRIAGILGAIDDKIENNRRINANLELQAQALYKQWFVDFEFPNEEGKPYKSSGGKMVDSELGPIPEGWCVGTLSDLADVTMGQSPNGKSFNENGDGIVFYQGRTEFGVRYPSIRLYTTEPTRYAEPMSVLLSVRAPVGDINIATQRCCIGRGVASIKSKTDDNAYMYCCLKELRLQLDQYNGEGTVFGSINRKELEGLVLCIPKYEIISKFNDVILGTDKQMLNLFQQTQNLATLRDTSLPKLMNGEIKLQEIWMPNLKLY